MTRSTETPPPPAQPWATGPMVRTGPDDAPGRNPMRPDANERRLNQIVCAQHAAKLAVTLSMDVARYSETGSDVQRQSALFYIRSIRAELNLIEAAISEEARAA